MTHDERHYPLGTVATALGLEIGEAYELRGSKFPDQRIPATAGTGTRDQVWSEADAARLAVVKAVQFDLGIALSPAGRLRLFNDVSRDAIARALDGDPVVLRLVLDEPGLVTADVDAIREFEEEHDAFLAVNVASVAREVVHHLRTGVPEQADE